jgi:hypothetical protein
MAALESLEILGLQQGKEMLKVVKKIINILSAGIGLAQPYR